MSRLPVKKTYKLYIGGAFPRSESGARTRPRARTSRAPRARTRATPSAPRAPRSRSGPARPPYNRGQVLYRLAEMMEARVAEFAELCTGRDEVERAIDRVGLVRGLGRQAAAGARRREPGRRPVLQLHRSRSRPASSRSSRPTSRRCSGSSRASRPRSSAATPSSRSPPRRSPLAAVELAEALATSDVPGGVVNLLTGFRARARARGSPRHMDVNAIDLCGADGRRGRARAAAADNVKRVVHGGADGQSLYEIASFLELKTVWHPIGR